VFQGCTRGAEGSTPFCKGHGGGRDVGVCPKSVHGGTSFCVAHGGGQRCIAPGCTKSARGRSDHCVKHGGDKRCRVDGCDKSVQGSMGLCKAHGGGKRCAWSVGCEKFARGGALYDPDGRLNAGSRSCAWKKRGWAAWLLQRHHLCFLGSGFQRGPWCVVGVFGRHAEQRRQAADPSSGSGPWLNEIRLLLCAASLATVGRAEGACTWGSSCPSEGWRADVHAWRQPRW
jgi:hypothetical protein